MSYLTDTLAELSKAKDCAGIAYMVRGIEKESLRITPNGTLATTPHPQELGSALTHPHITTDYSEALLEFITLPSASSQDGLMQLQELHTYTYQKLGTERLWGTSMPCMLGEDKDIPIAHYGTSNSGKMKSVYRMGLGHRYGRSMQTIAGIHYNFSVPDSLWQFLKTQEHSSLSLQDFKTQGYFKLIRNFRRYFWLLLYLFGASPGVCKSFVKDRKHQLVPFGDDANSLHTPYATSLRMGDLGYQSNAQESLVITYNCLESYIQTLCCAITKTHPEYASLGVTDHNGHHQQLNDSLLQIENEFYSVIRPKRTAQRGETALSALANGGIEYIEVRCLDLNPYEPLGINQQQIHFLDTFLLYCLFSESPPSDATEYKDIQENQKRMVYSGRDPELALLQGGKERSMREWAQELMGDLTGIAHLLDQTNTANQYQSAINRENEKLIDASLTPSAKVLSDMAEQGIGFYRFAANMSEKHKAFFANSSLDNKDHWEAMAQQSHSEQHSIEDSDTMSFEDYLADYYSQYQCASNAATANAE